MFAGVFSEQMLSLSSNALLDSRAILHVTCLVYHWPFLVTVLHFTLLAGVLHMYSCIAYHAHVPSSGFIFIKTHGHVLVLATPKCLRPDPWIPCWP